ncbi:transposase [Skermanella aerolata]|uniref:ISL3 family transposase n=1 Tax=Skermanella aerolata TaxID=393310 RepID=UPI003D1A1588
MITVPQPLLPAGLFVDDVTVDDDRITFVARAAEPSITCPSCGFASARVHSSYLRRIADLAWQGRTVELRVRVRRLRCCNGACTRRIFAEQLPQIAAARARCTGRLREIRHQIAFALGGRPGARLAWQLGLPVSANTLLRLLRSVPVPAYQPPRVVGIDDWAWRRGTRYGTIVCDLERNRVIDLLPDRKADTVADWLRRNPGIEMVARDRAGAFADGIRRGAPEAIQVADRWHLLRNLGDALQTVAERHRKAVRAAALQVAESAHADTVAEVDPPAGVEECRRVERRERRQEMYDELVRLRGLGLTADQIAPVIGLSRPAIFRWLKTGGPPQHRKPRPGLSKPCLAVLEERWAEGCRNAGRLWRDLRERGFKASERTVRRWAQARRRGGPGVPMEPVAKVAAAWPAPSKRQCARLLTARDEDLDPKERAFVAHLAVAAPKLAEAAELARRLDTMLKDGASQEFDVWLATARDTELASFAQGLKRDYAAVRAALTEPWSTSPVEGQINKLKVLKRQMYGRAKYDLLRNRLLAA